MNDLSLCFYEKFIFLHKFLHTAFQERKVFQEDLEKKDSLDQVDQKDFKAVLVLPDYLEMLEAADRQVQQAQLE